METGKEAPGLRHYTDNTIVWCSRKVPACTQVPPTNWQPRQNSSAAELQLTWDLVFWGEWGVMRIIMKKRTEYIA